MGEHLRTAPFPTLGVYGAQEDGSIGYRVASFLEKTRLRPLRWARDHALPLKKMTDRRYDTYTPVSIFKKGWTAKHQEQIPGGILVVYETDALTQTNLNSAMGLLDRVRANIVTCGRSSIPVALMVISTNDQPETTEEKNAFMALVKKATTAPAQSSSGSTVINMDRNTLRTSSSSVSQTPPCAIAVVSKLDLDKEAEGLHKFRSQLVDALHEFYKQEIARIKSIKRGGGRSGAVALKARHEFKCAQYYEMRSLPEKALNHYQESYQALATLASTWEREQTCEYQAHEIRSASEIVHYRMCALRLEAGEPRLALNQLRLHLKSMTPLKDPSHDQDEYWEWLSRQHVLFAGLLSSSSTSALTVAFGALDACERERCSGVYHLSRAALHAKRISRPERALDLTERLIETNARRRKIYARREATLLISVAEERFRVGDESGALRDLERAASVMKRDGWYQLYAQILSKMDLMFKKAKNLKLRLPASRSDVEAQYIVLYGKNAGQKQQAMEFLCLEKLDGESIYIEANLVQATMDEGGRRVLISSKFPQDLYLKAVHCSEDADADFGSMRVTDFLEEPALIPANGSLLVEGTDQYHIQNATTLLLTFNTGAKWRLPVGSTATPHMFALKRSDSTSKSSENHYRMGAGSSPRSGRAGSVDGGKRALPHYELICTGFPPGNLALVGESFHVEIALSDPVEKCLIECECDSNWVRIHGSTTPGKYVIEICPSDTIFFDQPTPTQIQIVAYLGTVQLAKTVIDLSVVWPLVIATCKRILPNQTRYVVEIECQAVGVEVSNCEIMEMNGLWSPRDRRAIILDLATHSKMEISVNRELAALSAGLTAAGPWTQTIQFPSTDDSSLSDKSTDGLECKIQVNPTSPYLYLGQQIQMTMTVRFTNRFAASDETMIMNESSLETPSVQHATLARSESSSGLPGPSVRSIRVATDQTDGFFLSGPDSITFNLYSSQETKLEWTLYPYEVGPHRFPGVWLEVSKGSTILSKKRVESVDAFCMVLPPSLMST